MENINAIFLETLRYFVNKCKSQRQFALKVGITPQYLNKIMLEKNYGSDEIRRKIAASLGYPNDKYEDFLNIGRKILAGQKPMSDFGSLPELSEKARQAIAEASPVIHLDGDLMIDVVTALEEFLNERKKKLNPRAKAEIIVQMYEMMKEEEAKGTGTMVKFKLITPLFNKALKMAEDDRLKKTG